MSLLTKMFGGGGKSKSRGSGGAGGGGGQQKTKGSGGGAQGPSTNDAIHKLRDVETMLLKKQDFLEKKIEQEVATARKNGTKNKRAAIEALKRKKRYENQLKQIDGTLSTLEMQRETLEGAHTNTEVLKTMSLASKALKATHAKLDVDDVHEMMDDIAEQQELAREMSEALSNPTGMGLDMDDDEFLRELEEMENEALDNELKGVEPVVLDQLPSVPSAVPVAKARTKAKKRSEDDDEMENLAAWAT